MEIDESVEAELKIRKSIEKRRTHFFKSKDINYTHLDLSGEYTVDVLLNSQGEISDFWFFQHSALRGPGNQKVLYSSNTVSYHPFLIRYLKNYMQNLTDKYKPRTSGFRVVLKFLNQ